jgi:hypothetical protein
MIALCGAIVYFVPSVTGSMLESFREKQDLDQNPHRLQAGRSRLRRLLPSVRLGERVIQLHHEKN